ncbi:3-deoxy-D-manno-octulosonic-acid transferase [Salinihabitans flavidus]|uniref:3-deoxy-D-manno-octulosonic acid transferase n=1 Tax=Salinihabitans flavidus TaxID=569882 RepID=A0A1H8T607_9RHOB|nr:glycosyltransferase N-terminal domain-containing protein [Salinihabitans flavidus]SEO85913.1 3-deoxy-D-manno-octulosonic-acid transferase [Salinihabitans flavidus]
MSRSLSLKAYLALTRRESDRTHQHDPAAERPAGRLLWLHTTRPEKAAALAGLGLRLMAQLHGTRALLTVPAGEAAALDLPEALLVHEAPSDNPGDIAGFLDHWRPDVGLWLGDMLRPAFLAAAQDRAIPLLLLEADRPSLESRRLRFLPDPAGQILQCFDTIFARSDDAARRLRRFTRGTIRIEESGQVTEYGPAPGCNAQNLEELTGALSGRPVWLAAHLQPEELRLVLRAYRAALRLAHRLLLVIAPDNPHTAQEMAAACAEEGWRLCRWDEGEMPQENNQILISADPRELGLWYRAAPITLMGSSLTSGHGGRAPHDAAALGSAILYGPGVRRHLDAYSSLARAGAARIVKDADSLAQALTHLMAPDQAAAMARGGWDIVTEGATVTDQITARVQDILDGGPDDAANGRRAGTGAG